MESVWYFILAAMLATYVVLDGFDLGVGILHLVVGRTDPERREALSAIGPVWDGNEVWLIASGGVLFFAFPMAYAAAFSGFYLPLIIVLWLLIGRGLSIEWRSHHPSPLWRALADVLFSFSSLLLAAVLGASLGNLVRGVPVDESGYFHIPLFTNFTTGPQVGVLDWYTLLVAAFSVALLAAHGATYLAWRTGGSVQLRAQGLSMRLWIAAVVLGAAVTWATSHVRPGFFAQLFGRVGSWPLTVLLLAGLWTVFRSRKLGRDAQAFLGSALALSGLLGATAVAMFPTLLRSTLDPAFSLDARGAAAGAHGLSTGLAWAFVGLPLAVAYAVTLFRSFAGKAKAEPHGY